ncbi:ATP-dependent DNA helicase RecQ [compost metagenome]
MFEQLRLIRRDLAERERVPSYIIFNDATLREMSVVCPQTEAAMLKIKGVGELKYKKYGQPFLDFFQNQGGAPDMDTDDYV